MPWAWPGRGFETSLQTYTCHKLTQTSVRIRYSLAGQDTRLSPERPGLESRWRKFLLWLPEKWSRCCGQKPVLLEALPASLFECPQAVLVFCTHDLATAAACFAWPSGRRVPVVIEGLILLDTIATIRYSLAGQDTRLSPERPGLESRWRKQLSQAVLVFCTHDLATAAACFAWPSGRRVRVVI